VNAPRVGHRLCLAGLIALSGAPACSFPNVELLGSPALDSDADAGSGTSSQDLEGGPLDADDVTLSVDADSALADATLDDATNPSVSVPDALPMAPDDASTSDGPDGAATSDGAVDCGPCPAGETCVNQACACTPDDVAKTCASLECGQATSNCGEKVNCGVSGTAACPQGQLCTQAGSCCAPTDPCAGRCGGVMVTNNCGQAVQCSAACANPPPDAGAPDSSPSCATNGAECTTAAACCSGACAPDTSKMGKAKGICAASCVAPAGSCTLDAQCCFPLMCRLAGLGRAACQ
jgi:hypothetical protein